MFNYTRTTTAPPSTEIPTMVIFSAECSDGFHRWYRWTTSYFPWQKGDLICIGKVRRKIVLVDIQPVEDVSNQKMLDDFRLPGERRTVLPLQTRMSAYLKSIKVKFVPSSWIQRALGSDWTKLKRWR